MSSGRKIQPLAGDHDMRPAAEKDTEERYIGQQQQQLFTVGTSL
jgi:hypothetical protein